MRIEVEIGTIQVDALPVGMTAEALRTAVACELTRQISSRGLPGIAFQGPGGQHAPPEGPARTLGFEIATGIYGGLHT